MPVPVRACCSAFVVVLPGSQSFTYLRAYRGSPGSLLGSLLHGEVSIGGIPAFSQVVASLRPSTLATHFVKSR